MMGKTLLKAAHVSLVIFAVSILLIQCKTDNKTYSQDEMYKDIYIDQFKLTYFRNLLIKSYNNSKAIQEIIAQDHSGFTEPVLSMEDLKLIDSLTTQDNFNLKTDSINSIGRVAEGTEGKHTLSYILDTLGSSWLDSLANNRYGKLDVSSFEP